MELGLTPLAWSPLGGGSVLTADGPLGAKLDELARAHNTSRTGVALAFVLAHPAGIIPIIGTGKPDRIRESAEAAHIKLTKAECYSIIAAAGRALP